jgi:hypothetical protein
MTQATMEKPKEKSKDSSNPSLRGLTRKLYKHVNKCKECKEADNAVNRVAHLKPLCPKGKMKLGNLLSYTNSYYASKTS